MSDQNLKDHEKSLFPGPEPSARPGFIVTSLLGLRAAKKASPELTLRELAAISRWNSIWSLMRDSLL